MSPPPDPLFDPTSDAFVQNPYAHYARLRAEPAPPFWAPVAMHMVARADWIEAITTNSAMVRSLDGHRSQAEAEAARRAVNWHDMPYHRRVIQRSLLDSDGPDHRRLRRLVFAAFQGEGIARHRAFVQRLVGRVLDEAARRGTVDFAADVAAPIPGRVIARFLGAPVEDAQLMAAWTEPVVAFFDLDRSPARKRAAEEATRDFYRYLDDLVREREARPRDDLISTMVAGFARGAYASRDEFISTCMLILMAGHGSSVDAIGSGLSTLLDHPDAMARLRADPSLLPGAIQEMIRYQSPLPFFHRHALEDVTVGAARYPAGTTFGLLYGAANRDPAAFAAPDTFDIDRMPNRHLAFGRGAHLCLGNHLARMTMAITFEALLARFATIERVGPTVWRPGLSVRGPRSVPVRLA